MMSRPFGLIALKNGKILRRFYIFTIFSPQLYTVIPLVEKGKTILISFNLSILENHILIALNSD